MTTDEQDSNKSPEVDSERAVWFRQFGYTGADDEKVPLRKGRGTASAQAVWEVRQGLISLFRKNNSLFHRAALAAHGGRRAYDPYGDLALPEFGAVTDSDGNWIYARSLIVVALLCVDVDGTATFAETPLVPVEAVKAA
jgi:hypothetical protein